MRFGSDRSIRANTSDIMPYFDQSYLNFLKLKYFSLLKEIFELYILYFYVILFYILIIYSI